MAQRIEQITESNNSSGGLMRSRREELTIKDEQDGSFDKAAQSVWFIVSIIAGILALRFILSLLGANPTNAFADLIYTLSYPFVLPFRGLLQTGSVDYGISRFEIETLLAIGIYILFGWAFIGLMNLNRRN